MISVIPDWVIWTVAVVVALVVGWLMGFDFGSDWVLKMSDREIDAMRCDLMIVKKVK